MNRLLIVGIEGLSISAPRYQERAVDLVVDDERLEHNAASNGVRTQSEANALSCRWYVRGGIILLCARLIPSKQVSLSEFDGTCNIHQSP